MEHSTGGWADYEETCGVGHDEDELPANSVVEKGDFKIYTTYSIIDGVKQKHERKFKVVRKKKLLSKGILRRRNLEKFGHSKGLPPGPGEETSIAPDEVKIEKTEDEGESSRRMEDEIVARIRNPQKRDLISKQLDRRPETPGLAGTVGVYESIGRTTGLGGGISPPEAGTGNSSAPDGVARYKVPMRGGESGGFDGGYPSEDPAISLRVTNLSEDTTEEDLRELFVRFGKLAKVFLGKDRETGQSRGFAYISYISKEDARRALEKLNGFGFRHLILKVEWARPTGREYGGDRPPRSGMYGGGYKA